MDDVTLLSSSPITWMAPRTAFACCVLLAALSGAAAGACPPANFSTVSGFSLSTYISKPWFSIQQAVNSYQSRDELYCVRAEYRRDPGDAGRLVVFNQGRRGSVTGPLVGTNMLLSAVVKDEANGKLAVGPRFIPAAAYGPYWVVATGPTASDYEWAIITGGPPTGQGSTPGTCALRASTGNPNGNGEGFWLFFRSPTPSQEAVNQVRAAAASKGLDLSVLVDVPQQGCVYAPFPKNNTGVLGRLSGLLRG